MATKTGVPLTFGFNERKEGEVSEEWAAPCGCAFHIFDGAPIAHEVKGSDETILIGKLAPHWHPCPQHRKGATP